MKNPAIPRAPRTWNRQTLPSIRLAIIQVCTTPLELDTEPFGIFNGTTPAPDVPFEAHATVASAQREF